MNNFDSLNLSKKLLDAVEYISDTLFTKYSGLDFTIKRNMEQADMVVFYIHDKETFFNHEFQLWAFKELNKEYLWPKKILNIVFMYQKK